MIQEARDIRELIDKLNNWTQKYDEGNPIVSDMTYDTEYFKLQKLEKETGIIYPDSPTQSISYTVVNNLEKVEHNHLMLSLDKTKDPKEVESFVKGHDWCGMFKMDGLTCSLTYEDGKLTRAETRGNGIIGENVFHNALVMDSIPKEIPTKETVIIDGEVICTKGNFNKFKDEYKNPRNFASGSIRLLDSKESAARNLTFVAWDLVKGCKDIDFFFWRLEKLDEWGFITVPRVGDAETVDDAIGILNDMRIEEPSEEYPIDGYVFRFESQKYYNSLGNTDHHFRGAIAYKFYDEEYETKLKTISYDVSRTGILTPVAVFEPVDFDGSVVERASLHNMSVMKEILGDTPYSGQPVWVIKANQIIPQITKAIKKNYGEIIAAGGCTVGLGGDYGILCPICGSLTEIRTSDSGVDTLYCTNEQCEGKLAQRIDHFCGKKGLDIKGISLATIEKLIDWGWINELTDIFRLNEHKTEWVAKPGFGAASVGKILSNIDAAKCGTQLSSFISALGIPLVGRTVAKEIVKYYPSWESFKTVVGGDWSQFEGFGPEISKAINNFDYSAADEIAKLFTWAESQSGGEQTPVTAIKDKTFCITGKLKSFKNRDALKADIEKYGGKVVGSVSKKVNYLINNDITSTSEKNKTAKAYSIPIITEEEYTKMTSQA